MANKCFFIIILFFHLQIQDTVFLFIIRGFIDTTSSHATKVWGKSGKKLERLKKHLPSPRTPRIRRRCFLHNRSRIEAGTLLYPLFGFYLAVAVQVGTEVAVTAEAAAGIIAQQQHYEHPQGVFLKIGAGIGRMSVRIESAFVADAQTVGVVAADMRTGLCHGTERLYIAVPADVIVITCAGEAPAQVVCCQVMFGVATVTAGSGTVNDDEVDKSHFY